MSGNRNIVSVLVLLGALLASSCLTFVSQRAHSIAAARDELARLGLEDAARRVADCVRWVSAAQGGSDAAGLAQAIASIERTSHVGRRGRVSIAPFRSAHRPSAEPRLVRAEDGSPARVYETACEGYLVSVTMPEFHPILASKSFGDAVIVVDLILLLLLIVALPAVRETMSENLHYLRALFGAETRHRSFVRRWLSNPLALVGFAVFALLLAVLGFVSARLAARTANDTLRTAAVDIDQDLRDCVDSLLFYQGDTICRHYGSPEKMTADEVGSIMKRYGLDELNVVNGRGIVLLGALADVGYDMGSKPKTAEFNRLLDGRTKTFSQRFRAPVENPHGVKRKYAGVAFDPPARGYLQLGLSETRLKDGLDYFIARLAEDWHIGDTGFFLIARAETGEIVSFGRDFGDAKTLANLGFDTGLADSKPDAAFEATIGGIPCLCRSGIVNRYHRYVAAIPLAEVYGNVRRLAVAVGIVLLVILVLAVTFMTRLSDLVLALRAKERAERERQLKDLTLARTIQTSSLPVVFPDEADYRIFARMDTAREVGGDFYDFYDLPTGEVVFLIADVSGKGVPAALFMMRAKALLRSAVFACPGDLAAAVATANDLLSEKNDAEMFVTAWVGAYDRRTRLVTFVNAGHNPPLVKRADGSVEWIRARGGLVLAATGGVRYSTGTVQLAPGDSIFLYTDGVTEAMDRAQRQYGEARLEKTLLANTDGLFVNAIRADVTAFVAGAEPSDDITMLALDVKAAS